MQMPLEHLSPALTYGNVCALQLYLWCTAALSISIAALRHRSLAEAM